MDDKLILKITDEFGVNDEYEILYAFRWNKNNKHYIIYTNNTTDKDNNINLYASIYYPDNMNKIDSIESKEEWDEVERQLILLTKGDGNEQ